MFHHLIPTNPALFFSKNDPSDPRMGDLVGKGSDEITEHTHIAIIGVPQEFGVARNGGRVGAAQAPDAIRAMFYRLTPYDLLRQQSIPQGAVVDLGNIRCEGELEEIHDRLTEVVAVVCRRGLVPLVLGGGHDITYAAASGVHAVHGTLGLINFDAHLDVRPPNPLRNSGTSFRMLIEEGTLAAERFVEFGIQSFANARAHVEWLQGKGGTIIPLDVVRQTGFACALADAYQVAGAGEGLVYGTLDMDGVRAADAPGVSATMPDGFAASELLETAWLLGSSKETVAIDIVEVNPQFDRDNQTAKLAAHAMMRFIAGREAATKQPTSAAVH